MLQVARIESGQFSYDLKPFDLGALVERTVEEVTMGEDARPIETIVSDSLPAALGDPERTWQVLTNLLSNASKASPEGETIVVEAQGGEISAESEVGQGSTFRFTVPVA